MSVEMIEKHYAVHLKTAWMRQLLMLGKNDIHYQNYQHIFHVERFDISKIISTNHQKRNFT